MWFSCWFYHLLVNLIGSWRLQVNMCNPSKRCRLTIRAPINNIHNRYTFKYSEGITLVKKRFTTTLSYQISLAHIRILWQLKDLLLCFPARYFLAFAAVFHLKNFIRLSYLSFFPVCRPPFSFLWVTQLYTCIFRGIQRQFWKILVGKTI